MCDKLLLDKLKSFMYWLIITAKLLNLVWYLNMLNLLCCKMKYFFLYMYCWEYEIFNLIQIKELLFNYQDYCGCEYIVDIVLRNIKLLSLLYGVLMLVRYIVRNMNYWWWWLSRILPGSLKKEVGWGAFATMYQISRRKRQQFRFTCF